jgi:hypothetical protein
MKQVRAVVLIAAAVTGGLWGPPIDAQSPRTFTARLAWVPISGAERANVTGKGSATGTLSGSLFTITGTFEGLAAPATLARLHNGIAKGARGPVIADLTITKAASGTIAGTATLTPALVDALVEGTLYVQVHSEKGVAPDGSNLWGWFLPGAR